ncbi:FMN-binding negative transcriptional regulator [Pseudomonas sp. Hp2]|uniref:FMN-binding negative transcriptional regulator n=1 Tax=Pseudomonas sp. Hp2 TaxID=701189 RepID=UPI001127458A|nr:FMN-binding negative transcriptional regulator [Pseudomonas sp. Hp2]
MYTPRAFAGTDLTALDDLFARDPFVTLVTPGEGLLPQVSHLPVLYARDGDAVVLEGHWARPNPQAVHEGQALAIVHGPHAYVSPGWYPDKEAAARVPTWNYAVAHLKGRLLPYRDEALLADLVTRLGDAFESGIGSDWRFETDRPEHVRQLRGIVGFRFEVASIELKLKLSQNHPQANVDAVIEALGRQPAQDARDTAAWMQRWRPRREASPG